MVADPVDTPVTSPVGLTVARSGSLVVHSNATPETTVFDAVRAVAESCRVCPTARLNVAGDTATLVIPTVTDAVPATPSLVAVIVTAPGLSPVTPPVLDTTAIVLLLEVQPTTRSGSSVVPARTVAESCTEAPTAIPVDAGATETLVTATGLTSMVAEPVRPSMVAKMTALPVPTPVTMPADDTVATDGAPVVHVTVRPVSTVPRASRATTVSVADCPTVRFAWGGVTSTEATRTGTTLTSAAPVLPSLAAMILVEPNATPVTTPVDETVAIDVLSEVYSTGRPARTLPWSSVTWTVIWRVCPGSTLNWPGET